MDGKLTRRAIKTTERIYRPVPDDTPGGRACPSRSIARHTSIKGVDPIRVLVVDDHEMVRTGLLALLGRGENIEVVGEAATVGAGLAEAHRLKPDIVLMDLRLPDGNGIDACQTIRAACPDTRLLMLTSFPDDHAVVAAFRAGASGFLLKETSGQDLIRAIETVARGQSILDPALTKRVMAHVCTLSAPSNQPACEKLSVQERRVLELVAGGKTNKEIAVALGISDKTVKNYLSHVYDKLQVTRRAQATSSFIQHTRRDLDISMVDLSCPLLPPQSS